LRSGRGIGVLQHAVTEAERVQVSARFLQHRTRRMHADHALRMRRQATEHARR
jgi:hypothetical protein